MHGLEKNNKGYSLVELIIVVAIIAVIGLGATWSIILVLSANAKTCANDIVSAISECKIMTMTKGQGEVRLIIYRDGESGTIYSVLQTKDKSSSDWLPRVEDGRQKIGASRCTVTRIESDGVTETPIPTSAGNAWEIYFDRSSGKLETTSTVDKIHVLGGRKSYRIGIERLTGKVTKELQ